MAAVVRSPTSPSGLDAALAECQEVLGAGRVITDAQGLRAFRDPFQFQTWEDNTASAVVSPTTVEEIQEIVRIANRHRVPLWTHGQGRNNGYGGPAPACAGQ